MDILSIRKKKGQPADAEPAAAAAVGAPKAPPSTSTPAKAKPTARPTISPQAPQQQRPERRAPAGPDPLVGFLARYDDEADATEQPAQRMAEAHDDTERYLAFELCGEAYAASIMDVREILTIRSLTEVPRAPREVLGVVSKRGLVLPVIDLATTLGLREPQRRLRTSQRVLVVGEGDRVCGLRVDAVAEVVKMSAAHVEPVPPSLGSRNAGLLLGLGRVGQTMYILLDLAAVLDAFAVSVGLAPTRTEVV
jgi:purine-binding chemotaxis protein CheW